MYFILSPIPINTTVPKRSLNLWSPPIRTKPSTPQTQDLSPSQPKAETASSQYPASQSTCSRPTP
ncbi:hypothetical protein CC78DRAFT_531115 [Lojkania enalia]|uniref:Uncharacterized protein n=1 Tax=Lojkania enalia TaxID=147567 RepID=A0A9P4N2A6_9PLEO|nr:hypothetical protein CC78DRAFT_531115 [Didymosphaeria enalia]